MWDRRELDMHILNKTTFLLIPKERTLKSVLYGGRSFAARSVANGDHLISSTLDSRYLYIFFLIHIPLWIETCIRLLDSTAWMFCIFTISISWTHFSWRCLRWTSVHKFLEFRLTPKSFDQVEFIISILILYALKKTMGSTNMFLIPALASSVCFVLIDWGSIPPITYCWTVPLILDHSYLALGTWQIQKLLKQKL